ncbi:MAG: type IV secretion system protein VirB10 [Pseudomonadales bacterium]|nr:type IV secretion system protein VirB10 [Pseudomonadales bacterium]
MESENSDRTIPPLSNKGHKWVVVPVVLMLTIAAASMIFTHDDVEKWQESVGEKSKISKVRAIQMAPDIARAKEPEVVVDDEIGEKPVVVAKSSVVRSRPGNASEEVTRPTYADSSYRVSQQETLPPNFDRNGVPSKPYLDVLKLNSPLNTSSSGEKSAGNKHDLASVYGGQYQNTGLLDANEERILQGFNQEIRGGSTNPNDEFFNKVSGRNPNSSVAVRRGNLEYTVTEGKMIPIVLETAIDSQLPGRVRGVVTKDVYGFRGNIPLIPRGSRVNGEYNSAVVRGQGRVFVVWNRLLTPEGIDINIGSAGADNLGRSGYKGMVNTHFWNRFGTSILLSIVGAGTATVGVEGSDGNNSASSYRQAISDSFQLSSVHALQNNISIADSIHKDQGERVMVFVAQDLDFTVLKEG